ncbi:MAG: response regulator [bacterium]
MQFPAPSAFAFEASGSTPHASKRTPAILVVDDDVAAGDALAFLLRGEGYAVVVTTDGEEGYRALQQRRFDAVLTDLAMPAGGRRWLARLRATWPAVPVVVVTALDTEASSFVTPYHLADAVLGKPVEAGVLLDVLKRVLTGARL